MFFVGLDLGQKVDPSAAVVVERIEHRRAFMPTAFQRLEVRYVERMPLGMPYPKVVERVREITWSQELQRNCALAVDATGVGAPVVDMLRRADLGCRITAITMTGGERANMGTGERGSVPKRDLLTEVQVLLETGKLAIGKVKERERLIKELTEVRVQMSGTGRVRMGADGYGEHDDLVIALSLACWLAKGNSGGTVGERSDRLY